MKKNVLQISDGRYIKYLPRKYSEKDLLEFTSKISEAETFSDKELNNDLDWLEPSSVNQKEPIKVIIVFIDGMDLNS